MTSTARAPRCGRSIPAAAVRAVKPARRGSLVVAASVVMVCMALGCLLTWQARSDFGASARAAKPKVIAGDGVQGPIGMVWVPGGEFLMGSDHKLAQRNERPAHSVRVAGFWMDRTHVTNAQFAAFVRATGYVTSAERKPDWEALRVQLPPGAPKLSDAEMVAGAMVFIGTYQQVPLDDYSRWWAYVPGADWRAFARSLPTMLAIVTNSTANGLPTSTS